jgi:uncharacterized protein with NAD-binding domain and iron-sulfur cluster
MRALVLGGGMAGLAAAHRLAPHGTITVVQRGWRLGGKGASHRTVDGRIEEHGLHIWPGYYDNAFRLMRQVYEHLDRPHTDPECPVRTWRDAFLPSNEVVVFEQHMGAWAPWAAHFRRNAQVPGLPNSGPTLDDLVRRGLGLLADLSISVGWRPRQADSRRAIYLSARAPAAMRIPTPADRLRDLDDLVRRGEMVALIAASQAGNALAKISPRFGLPVVEPVVEAIAEARKELGRRLQTDPDARRLWHVADLVTTALIGVYADRLLDPARGYAAINHVDFRDWLAGHGAEAATVDCGLVRGMYDLVFGYRDGDHSRPAFEAGTGLQLAGRFFFDYKGSLFWKMRAGMGDVVFAPLYQSLSQRGADFQFFHRVRRLRLDDVGRRIEAVELGRQARLRQDRYRPLIRTNGLPCFPDYPLEAQLDGNVPRRDLEAHPGSPPGQGDEGKANVITLRRGRDFDQVVLAVSLGMVPHVAAELIEADPRWAAMVTNVSTVATRSLQVWTATDEDEMGWPHAGSTAAGYAPPFDTYASMSHLLDTEGRRPGGPAAVSYFCSVLPEDEADPITAAARVADTARGFLERGTGHVWPLMRTPEGAFDWRKVLTTYTRANVDPSDRYVQSLPGSGAYRIPADASGFDNLAIAGDWTDSGLNAGCIEAAVVSGLQAANAVLGKEVGDDVLGGWMPLRGSGRRAP